MESRVEDAVALFKQGYNCSQAVFATYADLFGMEKDVALKLTSTMGAGIGRMREVCGTVSGMALLLGLKEGNSNPDDEAAKTHAYSIVREISDEFAKENGSIICKELLGILSREKSAEPSKRTDEYYQVRPCVKFVRSAAELIESRLFE